MSRNPFALAFWMATCALACIADSGEMRIERKVAEACREIDMRQASLSDVCSLADYRTLVKSVGGTNMWTSALQRALDEHEIVRIPASDETYFFDGTVKVPSNRRIEAAGATIRLADGMRTVLLRNANAQDGTLAPIPVSTPHGDNINGDGRSTGRGSIGAVEGK